MPPVLKLTTAEIEAAFAQTVENRIPPAAARKLRREGGLLRKRAAKRAWSKYLKDGGDPTSWEKFVEWLKANWPQILALLLSLFA